MDIKGIIPLICLVGVFAFGALKIKKMFSKMMAIDVSQREDNLKPLPPGLSHSGFAQYLRQPKKFTTELAMSGVSKDCEPYVINIEGLDLLFYKDPTFKVTSEQLVEPPATCSLGDDQVTLLEKDYLKYCYLSNPTRTDILTDDCVRSIFGLRSAMTAFLMKPKKIADIEELGELTDILYNEVNKSMLPDATPLDLIKTQAIVNQMLDISPAFHAAKKAEFYLRVKNAVVASSSLSQADRDDRWASLKKEFESLKASGSIEDGVMQAEAYVETRGYDPALTLDYAAKLLVANPNDAWADILSAYGHWSQDEHDKSFNEVKRSIEIMPDNANYQQVFNSLTQASASVDSFAPALKSMIVLQDFDK